jgi:hypothetical protein
MPVPAGGHGVLRIARCVLLSFERSADLARGTGLRARDEIISDRGDAQGNGPSSGL